MHPRRWAELQRQPRRAEAIGVDVAADGRDDTCWTLVDSQGVISPKMERDLRHSPRPVRHASTVCVMSGRYAAWSSDRHTPPQALGITPVRTTKEAR